MPFMELFDETLDINSTENYELSLQVSPDGVYFSLLDTIRNKFVLIRTFEPEENRYFSSEKINGIFSEDDFLKKRYKKVNVITPSPKFTIVPAPLFDPGKKDEYFTFNHIRDDGSLILSNSLKEPSAYLVFSLSKPVSNLINSHFPKVHPIHHITTLLCHISQNRKQVHGYYIHIHVDRDFFNLIIFDKSALKFCNTFNYRNITDIMYYVLNVFKNLDIKQEETIFFSGRTEKYDDLTSNFSLYIRNIKFARPTDNFSFSYVFNDTDLHRYINLFSTENCG